MKQFLLSAMAGVAGTYVMSLAMRRYRRAVPHRNRSHLPPRKISDTLIDRAGLGELAGDSERRAAATAAHYGFGASMGALYGRLRGPERPCRRSLVLDAAEGAVFGTLVWFGSYFGWLPALRLHPSPADTSAERNSMMIFAHWIFGGCLVLSLRALRALDGMPRAWQT